MWPEKAREITDSSLQLGNIAVIYYCKRFLLLRGGRNWLDILIVEDEFSINELIRRNLCLTGHRCTQAFDGPAAVSLLESGSFDLIVLDIMLPGLDGYQVFERAGGTPAIFLTARSELATS